MDPMVIAAWCYPSGSFVRLQAGWLGIPNVPQKMPKNNQFLVITLLETDISSHPKIGPKGKYSNNPFSGAFAVSFRELIKTKLPRELFCWHHILNRKSMGVYGIYLHSPNTKSTKCWEVNVSYFGSTSQPTILTSSMTSHF